LASKEQIGDFNQCITSYKLAIYNMKGFIIESSAESVPPYLRIGPGLGVFQPAKGALVYLSFFA